MLGKIEDKRRRVRQRMRWLDNLIDSMDMNLSKLQETEEEKGIRHNLLFNPSVVSNSLWPHGLPCPSLSPRVCSNLSPVMLSTISSSVTLFSYCPPYVRASRSFPMSQFFPSGGHSIRDSAVASVFPVNIQDWFTLGWTGWISLLSKGLSRVFSSTTVQKHQLFCAQLSL